MLAIHGDCEIAVHGVTNCRFLNRKSATSIDIFSSCNRNEILFHHFAYSGW